MGVVYAATVGRRDGKQYYPYDKASFKWDCLDGIEVGNLLQVNPDPTLIHQGIVGGEHQLSPSVARNESGGRMWTAVCQIL